MHPILMRIQKFLKSKPPLFIFLFGLFLVLIIGFFDYLTKADYIFDYFYLFPLFFVTWYAGVPWGFTSAVLAVLTWLVADLFSAQLPANPAQAIWRTFIELAVFLVFVYLMTLRKRDARRLDNSISLLNATLESTIDGILVVDAGGKIVSLNRRFAEMWKIPDAILEAHDDDQAIAFVQDQLLRPDDFVRKVRELYTQPEAESFDVLEFKDGRVFERYSKPQRIADKVAGRVWSFHDVTRGRLAEQENAQFAAIVDSSEDAIISKSLDGIITSWNRGAERIYGYIKKEVIGKPISILVPPGQEDEVPHILERLQAGENIEHYETLRLRKNGQIFHMSLTISPIYDTDGKIIAASTIGRDISNRKLAETKLEHSEAELRGLFSAMTDVVIAYDRDGRYLNIAPTDTGPLLEPSAKLIGKSIRETFPKPEAERYLQVIHAVLDTGTKMETEYSLQIGERTKWYACTISPMQEDSIVWVAHDITNRKRAEKIQETIYAISQAAISTNTIDELYKTIHSTLSELLHVDNFYIALYDPSSDLISFPYFVDQFDPAPLETKPRRGLTEYVLRSGQPILAPAAMVDQLIQQGEIENMGAASVDWLGVPLKVEGQVIGVMVTQSYQENIHFTQDDLRLFEFVSTQVGQMIDRKRVEQKVHYMGMHDALTGLYNRAYFDEELKRLERGRLFPVSLLMADLDKLKETNDRAGHAAGDELLRLAARSLKAAFRVEDVVARIGGDEFAVLLPGVDSKLAKQAKKRVVEIIKTQNSASKGELLQISTGISTVEKGASLVEGLKLADNAMYLEKQEKRKLHAAPANKK